MKKNRSNESQRQNGKNTESLNKRSINNNFELTDSIKHFRCGKAHDKRDCL